MRPDFILKNVMVYQTFRQCFEKRDVAVAGEMFYCVSPAISYPGVREIDGKGRYMLPGLVDIHMHIESSMTYPGELSRITLPYGVTTVVADAHEMANVFGMDGIRAFMAQKTKQDIFSPKYEFRINIGEQFQEVPLAFLQGAFHDLPSPYSLSYSVPEYVCICFFVLHHTL